MTHWSTFGRCYADADAARRWAAANLTWVSESGAHPVLVDAAVVHCPLGELCDQTPLPREVRELVRAS